MMALDGDVDLGEDPSEWSVGKSRPLGFCGRSNFWVVSSLGPEAVAFLEPDLVDDFLQTYFPRGQALWHQQ